MRACGIIAEYNPFHNGHAYLLQRARELSGAEYVIIAMSGQLMQRGELAAVDKWTRAQAAIESGADIVLELPALFAVREAQGFAHGGVALLAATGAVESLCFGCETDDISLLSQAAALLHAEPPDFHAAFTGALLSGMSHPAARAQALTDCLNLAPDQAALLASPNAALALEYLQALAQHSNRILPIAVKRTSVYHSDTLAQVCSATAIRANIRDDSAYSAMPASAHRQLDIARTTGVSDAFFHQLALHTIRGLSPEQLRAYPGMSEGLEHKFAKCARHAADLPELISLVKSKRYTRARITRLCALITLGVTRQFQLDNPNPTYLRALACSKSARELLAFMKHNAALPLITSPNQLPPDNQIMRLELRATDLWSECTAAHDTRLPGADYMHKFSLI